MPRPDSSYIDDQKNIPSAPVRATISDSTIRIPQFVRMFPDIRLKYITQYYALIQVEYIILKFALLKEVKTIALLKNKLKI